MTTCLYPKTYATIISRSTRPNLNPFDYRRYIDWVTARIDETGEPDETGDQGELVDLRVEWKNGGRSSIYVVAGKRIKIYRRPGVGHVSFRLVGD